MKNVKLTVTALLALMVAGSSLATAVKRPPKKAAPAVIHIIK